MQNSPLAMAFRRGLIGPRLASWNMLLQRLERVQLTHGSDVVRWNLKESGKFSVDSMYKALIQSDTPVVNNKKNLVNEDSIKDEGLYLVSS
jgi:hypothetical protein